MHLKSQIEVFITTVFLRVLESENSTFDHKSRVLEAVTTFSDTPQALVEVFLSYDCNQHASDLYSRIIIALSKVCTCKYSECTKQSPCLCFVVSEIVFVFRFHATTTSCFILVIWDIVSVGFYVDPWLEMF